MTNRELIQLLKNQRKIHIIQLPFQHEEELLHKAISLQPQWLREHINELDYPVLIRLLSYVIYVMFTELDRQPAVENLQVLYVFTLLYFLFNALVENCKPSEVIEIIENVLLTMPFELVHNMLYVLPMVILDMQLAKETELIVQ